ncbi:uncharacterized protein [Typha latifolia]|uniref:uncharacterized protein n=1 Tax=Typha latifolia TaxID=4733 RepID=UPI003C2DBA01
MAFHVACPITCRRICDCELGFPGGSGSAREREGFLEEIAGLEEFLRDPWVMRRDASAAVAAVEVAVPRVAPPPAVAPETTREEGGGGGGGGGGEESAWAASVRAKRAELQRQAAAASAAAEDYARKMEAGGVAAEAACEAANNIEDQDSSIVKAICRICFSGETEGSNRALKMLPCRICSKRYHRSCLKVWAEYRDLFHWSSWSCPSCRSCEVCRRTGDPTKLKFCKRCDGAYHCYCQQPPHKNVSHGPFLCPKHTRCHSCSSKVPGSGLSTRWFLSYTCCDACGRLFVKGKYCPVCLKVYRDSEMIPMVCCDVCQQWVHCECDDISAEKYQQFEADRNLYYKCPACRGDCYQVKDIEDAVRELWRRKDLADSDLIASLRSAAGLPFQEEIFSICPYSDDEESDSVIMKNEHEKPLKLPLKAFINNVNKKSKEDRKSLSQKSSSKKKVYEFAAEVEMPDQTIATQDTMRSLDSSFGDQKFNDMKQLRSHGHKILSSSSKRIPSNNTGKSVVDKLENDSLNVKEVAHNSHKVSQGSKPHDSHVKDSAGRSSSKSESAKGTKLVIHIGRKDKNTTSSSHSETSSCHKEPEFTAFNDKEDDMAETLKISKKNGKSRGSIAKSGVPTSFRSPITRKVITEIYPAEEGMAENTSRNDEVLPVKDLEGTMNEINDVAEYPLAAKDSIDSKPLLKLKFKNPYFEQRNSNASRGVEEKNPAKGRRSKRKRPSVDNIGASVDEKYKQPTQDASMHEVVDAKWILKKLGRDAIGKRVEVHEVSDDSWHKGVVSDVIEGTPCLSVRLNDGRSKILELGKQRVRFISQKQKGAKA